MNAPRVLQFTDYFHPHRGGIEVHVQTLARYLQESGTPVVVATPFPGQDMVDGVRVHRLAAPLLPRVRTIWTTHAVMPYLDLLRRERVDLVHVHLSIYNPAAAPAAFLAQRSGLPVVVTFHSILDGYTRALALFDRVTGWSRMPFTFTAVSEIVARPLSRLLDGRPVAILPCAPAYEHWRPVAAKPGDGTFSVVSTMRLVKRKRPRALIEALATVKDRLPGSLRLRARIIGDGGERAALTRLIAARGLGREVELLGTLTHDRMQQEYADADVFVLPSIEESFGLAALEARASGLPVVVRAGSGPALCMRHESEGLLVGSDAELAGALLRLALDAGLRARIASHNRHTAPPFRRDEVVRLHHGVYAKALGARG